jgi:formylglycine-generating enzyme required for sulfatase activity
MSQQEISKTILSSFAIIKPDKQPEKGPHMAGNSKSIYFSDNWAIDDMLGFDVYKPALMDIIQNAETPLTVGVFGTWGSGKTSLLRMLEKEIREMGLLKYRPVWFTAWKYDKQDALWRAFILRVIDELYPKEDNGERMAKDRLSEAQQEGVEYLDRLTKSVYQDVSWEGDSSWVMDWEQTKLEMVKLPFWLALSLVGQREAAKDMGMTPQMAEIIEREVANHHMQQLSSMEQFEKIFGEAVNRILGDDGRLIVFVDDLDRCLPEKAIEILEAIKLFLHVPQTIFVLGMDREIVRRGIESHYGTYLRDDGKERPDLPINGDSYLQKLIQLPFNLPSLDADGREKFIGALQKHLEGEQRLDEMTCQVFARGLLPNPRQVKRALNVFNLLHNIAEEQEKKELIDKGSVSSPLLAKTVLIQSQWPELYVRWRQYPILIQLLEEEYSRQPLTEQELLRGRNSPTVDIDDLAKGIDPDREETHGGILGEYLNNRSKYDLLAKLLNFPSAGTSQQKQPTRFSSLKRSQMQVYFSLAGTAEPEAAEDEALADLPTNWKEMLQSGDETLISDALAQIDEQEKEPEGPLHEGVVNTLVTAARSDTLEPRKRAVCADAADKIGYVPDDLYNFVPVIDVKETQFLIGKYPVTNAQYCRFVGDDDFMKSIYWMEFSGFDEKGRQFENEIDLIGWRDFQTTLENHRKKVEKMYPSLFFNKRFGIERPNAPVVGVSWYEANAYCKWLLLNWEKLEESEYQSRPRIVRLPTRAEWVMAAGGEYPNDRFPWGEIDLKASHEGERFPEVIKRANVKESKIARTTSVWMYPQGISQPYGVMDMGGNVWTWQADYQNDSRISFWISGGSWCNLAILADVKSWSNNSPISRNDQVGFRVAIFN